jgi:hypothetical protein
MINCHDTVGWYDAIPSFIYSLLIVMVLGAVFAAVPLELTPASVWGCEF